jgi:hypothetical protein
VGLVSLLPQTVVRYPTITDCTDLYWNKHNHLLPNPYLLNIHDNFVAFSGKIWSWNTVVKFPKNQFIPKSTTLQKMGVNSWKSCRSPVNIFPQRTTLKSRDCRRNLCVCLRANSNALLNLSPVTYKHTHTHTPSLLICNLLDYLKHRSEVSG